MNSLLKNNINIPNCHLGLKTTLNAELRMKFINKIIINEISEKFGKPSPIGYPVFIRNQISEFYTPPKDDGPFRGETWYKWVGYDLSKWWIKDQYSENVKIYNENDEIKLDGLWIPTTYPNKKETIVVLHGLTASYREFNVL